ncbi:MAG: DsrE family protein [Desulfovibrionales bacterium]
MTERGAVESTKLCIVWSTADREVALNMIFMFAENSRKHEWWERVRIVVWGPSARTIVYDGELQVELGRLSEMGVELQACRACAERYGVTKQLEDFGLEVKFMGQPLTDMLMSDWKVIAF